MNEEKFAFCIEMNDEGEITISASNGNIEGALYALAVATKSTLEAIKQQDGFEAADDLKKEFIAVLNDDELLEEVSPSCLN